MDNCGGASLFILLAAEKNEQRNDLSTPLLRNYHSFGVTPILPMQHKGREKVEYFLSYRQKSHNKRVSQNSVSAVSRSISEHLSYHYRRYFKPPPLCFAQQNIGEVSEGRRG